MRKQLHFGCHVSIRTVSRRLNEQRKSTHKTTTTVIDGLDGIGHVTISVEIFVIGNESIGQMKVDFYCAS